MAYFPMPSARSAMLTAVDIDVMPAS